jgi:Holliday junction resolvase
MSRAKRIGTAAETAVVAYLREHGWPKAERRGLAGANDRGDIIGGPEGWALEVKASRTPAYQQWLREAEAERVNAAELYGAVVHKPHGVGDANTGRWHVVMDLATFVRLNAR